MFSSTDSISLLSHLEKAFTMRPTYSVLTTLLAVSLVAAGPLPININGSRVKRTDHLAESPAISSAAAIA